ERDHFRTDDRALVTDVDRDLFATEPRARAGDPGRAPLALALDLAEHPFRLPFREREAARDGCTARDREPQAAVLRDAHHIAARKTMPCDVHGHVESAERQHPHREAFAAPASFSLSCTAQW